MVVLFSHPGYMLWSSAFYMESSVIQVRKLTQLKTNPTEKKSYLEVSSVLAASHLLSGFCFLLAVLSGLQCSVPGVGAKHSSAVFMKTPKH